jgi:hypothetical protein
MPFVEVPSSVESTAEVSYTWIGKGSFFDHSTYPSIHPHIKADQYAFFNTLFLSYLYAYSKLHLPMFSAAPTWDKPHQWWVRLEDPPVHLLGKNTYITLPQNKGLSVHLLGGYNQHEVLFWKKLGEGDPTCSISIEQFTYFRGKICPVVPRTTVDKSSPHPLHTRVRHILSVF